MIEVNLELFEHLANSVRMSRSGVDISCPKCNKNGQLIQYYFNCDCGFSYKDSLWQKDREIGVVIDDFLVVWDGELDCSIWAKHTRYISITYSWMMDVGDLPLDVGIEELQKLVMLA